MLQSILPFIIISDELILFVQEEGGNGKRGGKQIATRCTNNKYFYTLILAYSSRYKLKPKINLPEPLQILTSLLIDMSSSCSILGVTTPYILIVIKIFVELIIRSSKAKSSSSEF